jgi:hypothetical protein
MQIAYIQPSGFIAFALLLVTQTMVDIAELAIMSDSK